LSSPLCKRRTDCRLCGSTQLTEVLSLAPTPPANAFVGAAELNTPQPTFPLDVFFCDDCGHVQLLDVVDPEVLFGNYVYVSGTSPVFVKHFADYAEQVTERYAPDADGDLALDIGSNDGTLLAQFRHLGFSVLGVDPARDIAKAATEAGIETLATFFTAKLARDILAERGPAQVITANNVFAHADDLADIADGVATLLAPDGVFVFEVSYLVDVYEKTLFDTIYHEHLAYHSVGPLAGFLARHGLELIAAERVGSHGGSLRATAQRAGGPHAVAASVSERIAEERRLGLDRADTLKGFGAKIDTLKAELTRRLAELKQAGKSVAGFGAPAKATTLMYHFGIGPDVIDFIVDDSPLKQGLYSPGMHIPVLPSSALYDRKPDAVVILAWNFAEPIMRNHARYLEAGGQFIVPVPKVEAFPS
jgi:SAM-dependent methyltransferase